MMNTQYLSVKNRKTKLKKDRKQSDCYFFSFYPKAEYLS